MEHRRRVAGCRCHHHRCRLGRPTAGRTRQNGDLSGKRTLDTATFRGIGQRHSEHRDRATGEPTGGSDDGLVNTVVADTIINDITKSTAGAKQCSSIMVIRSSGTVAGAQGGKPTQRVGEWSKTVARRSRYHSRWRPFCPGAVPQRCRWPAAVYCQPAGSYDARDRHHRRRAARPRRRPKRRRRIHNRLSIQIGDMLTYGSIGPPRHP